MNEFDAILSRLLLEQDPVNQRKLMNELRCSSGDYDRAIFIAQRSNPFLNLDRNEINDINERKVYYSEERIYLLNRQLAALSSGRRLAVFSMPKSGSSFVQSAIQAATKLPFVSLITMTSRNTPQLSDFGINGREQELDELAIILQTIRENGSWVAQHHTRFTPFLGQQLRFFNIRPIVVVRNIFDTIVSMDDMIMGVRPETNTIDWKYDPFFPLPFNYPEISQSDRLTLLCESFGRWQINFYISWMRGIREKLSSPLFVRYEENISGNRTDFAERISNFCDFNAQEVKLLLRYIDSPNKVRSRMNKGESGRGQIIGKAARDDLVRYFERFSYETSSSDYDVLFG